MLKELNIKNFALIDDINIVFEPGFNIIMGETGTGKSNIIDAISILLGSRAQKDKIRKDKDRAFISASFDIENESKIIDKLKEQNIFIEDEPLIISRELYLNSNSITRINNIITPVSYVKELSALLLDIYGQFENINILSKSLQRRYIDSLGNIEHKVLIENFQKLYKLYLEQFEDLNKYMRSPEQVERDIDFLKYQIEEINNSNILNLDENILEQKLLMFENYQELKLNTSKLLNIFDFDGEGLVTNLGRAANIIDTISTKDNSVISLHNRVNEIFIETQDIKEEILNYFESLEFDEEEYQQLNEKKSILFDMKKKYGNSIEQIKIFLKKAEYDLAEILDYENNLKIKEKKVNETFQKLQKYAETISSNRKNIAVLFEEKIVEQLVELNMKDSKFKVQFSPINLCKDGVDEITFFISFNFNEPLKELSSVASGGEISRFMLALKSIEANYENIQTLVFDEIDTGISGNAGDIVGNKLKKLSKLHQLICISHLPQIIAKGNNHLLIYKEIESDKISSKVKKLNYEEKIKYLAKVIEGDNFSEFTLKTAKNMIDDNMRGVK